MDFIWNKITEWLKEMMIGGILGNLQGLFDNVNQQVGNIAGQVGTTPQAWNGSIYNLIRNLSNNVILPIAGVILAIVMTMELLQLVVEKNNMHDFETWLFFKWVFSATRSHTNTIPQGIKLCGRLDRVVLKMGGFYVKHKATTDTLMSGMMG